MKAVGVIGPDFEPRLFDIDEPTPARDGIVVKVLASSVNEFDRAAVRGHQDHGPFREHGTSQLRHLGGGAVRVQPAAETPAGLG